jgi:hypothetical protein
MPIAVTLLQCLPGRCPWQVLVDIEGIWHWPTEIFKNQGVPALKGVVEIEHTPWQVASLLTWRSMWNRAPACDWQWPWPPVAVRLNEKSVYRHWELHDFPRPLLPSDWELLSGFWKHWDLAPGADCDCGCFHSDMHKAPKHICCESGHFKNSSYPKARDWCMASECT